MMLTAAAAPDFAVPDQLGVRQSLNSLMSEKGLLLGFTADVWQPASVRRILWMQRFAPKIMNMQVNVALVACDQQYRLYGFHMSSPLPLPFLMLADHDGALHRSYGLDRQPGLVLIDHSGVIRQRWNVSGESIWSPMQSIVQAIASL